MAIRSARAKDIEAIRSLLTACNLPAADVGASPITFFLAEDDTHTISGCVGLEEYGDVGLLRSLAINPAARNAGIGRALVSDVEVAARLKGIKRLYLLTLSASEFFVRCGYQKVERASAPDNIRGAMQFAEPCPASATLMTKLL
jgi:amino-acid N-acetyltransferase